MSKCAEKCEVYSRVTGYYRPVSNWNKGKQEEFKERKTFKPALPVIVAAILLLTSGCNLIADHKSEIHAAILELVEEKGQPAAFDYIDKLVTEGKLGAANAEKLKEAIPQGVEKLKEAMKEDEQ